MKMNPIYLMGLLTIGSFSLLTADCPDDSLEGLIATPNWFFTSPKGEDTTTNEGTAQNPDNHDKEKEEPRPDETKPEKDSN